MLFMKHILIIMHSSPVVERYGRLWYLLYWYEYCLQNVTAILCCVKTVPEDKTILGTRTRILLLWRYWYNHYGTNLYKQRLSSRNGTTNTHLILYSKFFKPLSWCCSRTIGYNYSKYGYSYWLVHKSYVVYSSPENCDNRLLWVAKIIMRFNIKCTVKQCLALE